MLIAFVKGQKKSAQPRPSARSLPTKESLGDCRRRRPPQPYHVASKIRAMVLAALEFLMLVGIFTVIVGATWREEGGE